MSGLLENLDWQGKVYSSGWTASRGGVLESTEPATGEVLATVGLAATSRRRPPRPGRPSRNGPRSPGRSGPR